MVPSWCTTLVSVIQYISYWVEEQSQPAEKEVDGTWRGLGGSRKQLGQPIGYFKEYFDILFLVKWTNSRQAL